MMSGPRPQQLDQPVVLQITSDTANVAKVRTAVVQAAQEIGFAEPDVSAIALAINEAIANVIQHGYEGRPGEPIEVTIKRVHRADNYGLQITICDCGRQVDPGTIAGRELENVRPGGLGTHIIKTVCDEVEYTHRQPAGMQLRVLKMLNTRPDNAGDETSRAKQE